MKKKEMESSNETRALNSKNADQEQKVNDDNSQSSIINTTTINNYQSSNTISTSKSNVSSIRKRVKSKNENIYAASLQTAINDRRTTCQQNISIIILLITNAFERFAYYGLIGNYVLYLNKKPLYWESYNASTLLLIFLGVTYVSSLLGGWIADSFLGKFITINLSFIIYIIGYAAFPLLAYNNSQVPNFCASNFSILNWTIIDPPIYNKSISTIKEITKMDRSIAEESCSWVIIITVVCIGAGVGFLKANLSTFGADQVISRGQSMVFKYFNWLYWCINLGSLFSFGILAFVQQSYSFFIGYAIPFGILVLSYLLFISGSCCYLKQETEISILTNVLRVIIEAFKSVKRQKNLLRQKQRERALLSESEDDNISETSHQESYNNSDSSISQFKSIPWLDNAKIRYGGRFDDNLVDDVKSLKKIVLLFVTLIPYWIVYVQVESTYVVQGLHMKLFGGFNGGDVAEKDFLIPTAWLPIADQLTVLIMIPILDKFVYPLMKKKTDKIFRENTRLVFGMGLSAFSVIAAGLLETYRLDIILQDPEKNTVYQIIDNTTYSAADLYIAWQIPQYTLVGLGEVFCSVSAVYYAYSAAPTSMQSLIMGLFYFFTGISSFLSSITFSSLRYFIYSSVKNDDINCARCHLNYYFYILAGFQILGMITFIIFDSRFSIARSKSDYNSENLTDSIKKKNRELYDEVEDTDVVNT